MREISTTVDRRALEEEARRAHILNVSERLFAEQGLHDTSVADIARAAQFGVGTLYKYFKDKSTLIESLLADRLTTHYERIISALTGTGSPVEIINRVIDAFLASIRDNEQFFNVYFTHFHPGMGPQKKGFSGSLRLDFLTDQKKRILQQMEIVFQKGILKGDFIDVEGHYLANALFGLFIAFAFSTGDQLADDRNLEKTSRAMKRVFFQGVTRNTNAAQESKHEGTE